MNPDSIPRQTVKAALRLNLPFFGMACVVFLVGVGALLLASVRAWDRLLLWLGSFSVLYAVRLFVENDLVHAAMNVQGQELAGWTSCLTYLIPIPYALFARTLWPRLESFHYDLAPD